AVFLILDDWADRGRDPKLSAAGITAELLKRLSGVQEALALGGQPPPIASIGHTGGFSMMIKHPPSRGYHALVDAASAIMSKASQTTGLSQMFTLFETPTPQLYLDIDRTKAQLLGINVPEVFAALQVYIGSAYVNDFNLFGKTFRVTAQADAPY